VSTKDPSAGAAEPGAGAERAVEAELAAMTSTDMMLQAAVLLLNIGGRRLGLAPPSAPPELVAQAAAERDLEQVRDAVDSARALIDVLERRLSADELRPLRDALSQLQMAYAREVQSGAAPAAAEPGEQPAAGAPPQSGTEAGSDEQGTPAQPGEGQRRPGPAEQSGRLWVPGR
jgi:hypothetical protein